MSCLSVLTSTDSDSSTASEQRERQQGSRRGLAAELEERYPGTGREASKLTMLPTSRVTATAAYSTHSRRILAQYCRCHGHDSEAHTALVMQAIDDTLRRRHATAVDVQADLGTTAGTPVHVTTTGGGACYTLIDSYGKSTSSCLTEGKPAGWCACRLLCADRSCTQQ